MTRRPVAPAPILGWGTGSGDGGQSRAKDLHLPLFFLFSSNGCTGTPKPWDQRAGGSRCLGIISATYAAAEPTTPSAFWEQCRCTPRRPSFPMHPGNAPCFPGKRPGVSPAGIQRWHQEVSPGPGKPTPVTAPRSTRGLITVSREACHSARGEQEGGTGTRWLPSQPHGEYPPEGPK